MKLLRAAALSAVLVSAGTIAAQAAYQAPASPGYPPQTATNPAIPYANAPQPGPMVGSNPSIQSPQAGAGTFSMTGSQSAKGSFYSRKGFGPAPN
jgi:hypothetical protein